MNLALELECFWVKQWAARTCFAFPAQQLNLRLRELPAEDFASAGFDMEADCHKGPRRIVLFLSSQRSGSTLLCQVLRSAGICNAHEYFQTSHYMPVLASRWNAIEQGGVRFEAYWQALWRYRCASSGILGINLHADHLPVFEEFLVAARVGVAAVYIMARGDIVGQAISYEIASQTGRWSSSFAGSPIQPKYSFGGIRRKIEKILLANSANREFANKFGNPRWILYEQLIENVDKTVSSIAGDLGVEGRLPAVEMRRQSNEMASAWRERFFADLGLAKKSRRRRWLAVLLDGRFGRAKASLLGRSTRSIEGVD